MWYEFVEEEHFLRMIYSEIPDLKNITINKIDVDNQLNNVNIIFEMPFYCDNEPEKWKKQSFNTVIVNLRCCNVENIQIMRNSKNYKGNIQIDELNSLLELNVSGDFIVQFVSEVIMIQKISGYKKTV